MDRIPFPSSKPAQRTRATPLGALVLLLLSYGLTLLVPQLVPRLRTLTLPSEADLGRFEAWLPLVAAASLGVGLVAAFVQTLKRMGRDFRCQPCVGLAAALVATLGLVLIALRAPLTFAGQASGALAVGCLSLSLLGGALVQRGGVGTALLGTLVAALPCALPVIIVEAQRAPDMALGQAFVQLDEVNRLFLILMAVAGALMAAMALIGRALLDDGEPEWPGYEPDWRSARPLTRDPSHWGGRPGDSWFGAATQRASQSLASGRERFASARASTGRKLKTLWNTKAGEAPPYGFSVWRYHDDADVADESELAASLRRGTSLSTIVLALLMVAGVAVSLWAAFS